MGTVKRERQKANRQLRLEELAKQARKDKTKRFGLRVGLIIAAVVALVGGVYLLNGGGDDKVAATTSTTDTTIATPPRPVVSLPAEIPTELKVTTITEGTGVGARVGDTMEVHYLGVKSSDGSEFDNSYDTGSPIAVTLGQGQVIAGWEQGLLGLKVGGRYQIDIPSDLAYGDTPAGGRPAGALSFVVDIMSVTSGS